MIKENIQSLIKRIHYRFLDSFLDIYGINNRILDSWNLEFRNYFLLNKYD